MAPSPGPPHRQDPPRQPGAEHPVGPLAAAPEPSGANTFMPAPATLLSSSRRPRPKWSSSRSGSRSRRTTTRAWLSCRTPIGEVGDKLRGLKVDDIGHRAEFLEALSLMRAQSETLQTAQKQLRAASWRVSARISQRRRRRQSRSREPFRHALCLVLLPPRCRQHPPPPPLVLLPRRRSRSQLLPPQLLPPPCREKEDAGQETSTCQASTRDLDEPVAEDEEETALRPL